MGAPPVPPPLPIQAKPRQCGLALASLLLGIAGLACLCVPAGIPGVICGHLARRRIRKSAGTLSGNGLALGGLVTGYVAIALLVLAGLYAAVAIPRVAESRQATRNDNCVANLKAIQAAKTAWEVEFKKQPTDTPRDSDLFGPHKYLRQKPTCPDGGTYRLNSVAEKPTCSIPGHAY